MAVRKPHWALLFGLIVPGEGTHGVLPGRAPVADKFQYG
jgi:hypothetical protein